MEVHMYISVGDRSTRSSAQDSFKGKPLYNNNVNVWILPPLGSGCECFRVQANWDTNLVLNDSITC